MKILHLANTAGIASGGIGNVAHELFSRQMALGVDVSLWFPGDSSLEAEVREITGVRDKHVRAISSLRFAGRFLPIGLPWAFRDVSSFDLIHQHGIWLPNSLLTLLAGSNMRRIISPHGLLEPERLKISSVKKRFIGWLFENRNLARADCLAACSRQEVEGFRAYNLRNPFVVVPNGVADDMLADRADRQARGFSFRAENGLPPSSSVVLYLSRIDRIKGIESLLTAVSTLAERMRERKWVLVIAGDGDHSYMSELKTMTAKLHLGDLVRFVGPLFGERKIEAYCAADVFALVSKNENFGIVVAEALAMSVPVLVSESMPWSDVEQMGIGFICDSNAGSVARNLGKMIDMPAGEREAMGQFGRKYAIERFKWNEIAVKYIEIYRMLIARDVPLDLVIE